LSRPFSDIFQVFIIIRCMRRVLHIIQAREMSYELGAPNGTVNVLFYKKQKGSLRGRL